MPNDLDILQEKATAGDKKALFELGMKYYTGDGVTQDMRMALRHFNMSAMKGYGPAQCQMAYMSENGQGTKKNPGQAEYWTMLATTTANECLKHLNHTENDVYDQYFLGIYYQIIKKNEEEAAKWFQRALVNPEIAENKNLLLPINSNIKLTSSNTTVIEEPPKPTLPSTHYPYHKNKDEKGGRFHAFAVNIEDMREELELTSDQYVALNSRYNNLEGDHLKSAILSDFKEILQKTDAQSLSETITTIKSSPEYKILAKGQGFITKMFDQQTSSIKALEEMIKERKDQIGEVASNEGDTSSRTIR